MKAFKIILKILLVIVLVVSVVLNILLFNSSYGSLILKYDEQKFISMNSVAYINIDRNFILQQKNYGLQFEATSVEGCKTFSASYYIDNKLEPTFTTKCTYTEADKEVTKTTYYKDNVLYTDINGEKSKKSISYENALNDEKSMFSYLSSILLEDTIIKEKDSKTKISFCFSPFYFAGIRYGYKDDAGNSYKYDYDLTGNLRKITVTDKDKNKQTYKISYKDTEIDFPNFSAF